ncbi:hypothetical protein J3E69DRAFT_364755 [Trichoderma sp. SZMC 28015]
MSQLYSLRPMGNYGHWTPYDDEYEHPAVDSDMSIGQAYPTDEATPILNWKYSNLVPTEDGILVGKLLGSVVQGAVFQFQLPSSI